MTTSKAVEVVRARNEARKMAIQSYQAATYALNQQGYTAAMKELETKRELLRAKLQVFPAEIEAREWPYGEILRVCTGETTGRNRFGLRKTVPAFEERVAWMTCLKGFTSEGECIAMTLLDFTPRIVPVESFNRFDLEYVSRLLTKLLAIEPGKSST